MLEQRLMDEASRVQAAASPTADMIGPKDFLRQLTTGVEESLAETASIDMRHVRLKSTVNRSSQLVRLLSGAPPLPE